MTNRFSKDALLIETSSYRPFPGTHHAGRDGGSGYPRPLVKAAGEFVSTLLSFPMFKSRERQKPGPMTSPRHRQSFNKKFLLALCAVAALVVTSCASRVTLRAPAPANPRTYLAGVCAELTKCWPTNRTVNIVCHGHSVPAGYARTPAVRTFDAYPYLLHRGLNERFPHAVINVIVTGIGGENSEQGAKRFRRDVLRLSPDVVTIDYALNDRAIGLPRAKKSWRTMIEMALAAHVKVLLLTPTADMTAHLDDPNDPLNQHAEQIRRLAAEYHVGLVDSLQAFKDAAHSGVPLKDLMAQSNHPNRRGHELVAKELLSWFPIPEQRITR